MRNGDGKRIERRRGGWLQALTTALGVAALWGALAATTTIGTAAWAAEAGTETETEKKKSVDAAAVYVGDARDWTKPAEVDADAVYAEIAEYKEIVDKKIEATDPKYGVLMCKARKKFVTALRAVAKDAGYDLVARLGSVKGVDSVPVITQDVIAKL